MENELPKGLKALGPQALGLSTSQWLFRLTLAGGIPAVLLLLFAWAGGWFSPGGLTPASMINTFQQINGVQPGFRRNHAKGVCFRGWFESNGQGQKYSKAAVFAPGQVPVIGRFALAGGMPFAADTPQNVRSMAVLFQLPNAEEWRTGMNNIPVFPVNSAQAFHDLLLASAPDPQTGKADPAKMKAFFEAYPSAASAMKQIGARAISSGFEDSAYQSLNAFRLISATGESTPVRWSMEPVQPVKPLASDSAASADKNFLFDQLLAAEHAQPLHWKLVLTIGQPGDSTSDATIAWPPDRPRVEVGTLTVERFESEDTSPARDINFDPLILPVGIVGSDDPLLSARSAAYSQSFTRREGEPKTPSAVSPAEVQKP